MKKFSLKILSIALILILATTLFCSCNKADGDAMAPGYGGNYEGGSEMGKSPDSGTIDTERKIIKTVSINAQTKEFDKTIENINTLCSSLGGYIENSSVSGNSYGSGRSSRYASYTLRIPSEKLDQFTGDMENSVNVTSITSNIQEITDAYYDAVARLQVLESQRASLQKMYESFDEYSDINDMMVVQDKLYDVIEEIESYKARINAYDSKVAYSTVTISLYEVVEYTAVDPNGPTFGERIWDAFKTSWKNFWEFCQDFTVVFIRAIPTLLLLGSIAFGIFMIIWGSIRRARKKRIKRSQNQ